MTDVQPGPRLPAGTGPRCANGHPVSLSAVYCRRCHVQLHPDLVGPPAEQLPVGEWWPEPDFALLEQPRRVPVRPHRRWYRSRLLRDTVLAAIVITGMALLVFSYHVGAATLTGNYVYTDQATAATGCSGPTVNPTAIVTVTGPGGAVPAQTVLGQGTVVGNTCTFHFTVLGVRTGFQTYTVNVAGAAPLTVTAAALSASGWTVNVHAAAPPQ